MAVRRLADDQPKSFEFTPDNLDWAHAKVADYPEGRQASAVIPILWRAQEQNNGWLPEPAIRLVADMLDMPYIRVFEIATFYTMFQLKPVGTVAHIGVCGTTPCMLRGSEDIISVCKKRIAAHAFDLSADGRFSWEEVECAGACVNAPMVQIGADTYEDLTVDSFNALLDTLGSGGTPEPGPQSARRSSEPLSGATTLTEPVATEAPPKGSEVSDPDSLPESDVDPTAPETRHQSAGRPSGEGRTESEVARSGGDEKAGDTASGDAPKSPAEDMTDRPPESQGLKTADAVDILSATGPEGREADAAAAQAPSGPSVAESEGASSEVPELADKVDAAPEESDTDADDVAEPPNTDAAARADTAGTRPPAMSRSDAEPVDDLMRMSGIGKVIRKTLNDLGVFRFEQIAAWDQANKDWVNAYLAFKGRIDRENWVEQARLIIEENRDKS